MKHINKLTKAILLITAAHGGQALASQVGAVTTFTAGTPAVAAEVNGNFDAVTTAVNDNDTRLTSVEGETTLNTYNIGVVNTKATNNEANIAINTANIATNSANIADNATLITNLSTSVSTMQNGVFSVGPMSMNPTLPSGCIIDSNVASGYANFNSTSSLTICDMTTNVHLPQGMGIGGLTCRVYDNDGTANSPLVQLYRANHDGSGPEKMFETAVLSDSLNVQLVTDYTNATQGTVDNYTYNYYLVFDSAAVDTSTAGTKLRFYNCQISYGNLL